VGAAYAVEEFGVSLDLFFGEQSTHGCYAFLAQQSRVTHGVSWGH